MTETTENTITRPITGDVQSSRRSNIKQQNAAEFLEALDKVLAFEGVEGIRWEQYTPYFNDGEPCEFSTGEVRIRLTGVDEEDGDYEDGYLTNLYTYGDKFGQRPPSRLDASGTPTDSYVYNSKENPEYREWVSKYYSEANHVYPLGEGTKEVQKAFDQLTGQFGAFEHVLQDNFGDPAQVTATREGFDVEYYEHD